MRAIAVLKPYSRRMPLKVTRLRRWGELRALSQAERRRVNGQWPEALEPLTDTYVDQVFQGPLG